MTNETEDKRSAFERDQVGPDDTKKRRPTVTLTCSVPNGLTMQMHSIGEGKPWQLGHTETLKAGPNTGIDKEFALAWLEENKNLSLVVNGMVTATDEPDPEDDQAARDEDREEREERHQDKS